MKKNLLDQAREILAKEYIAPTLPTNPVSNNKFRVQIKTRRRESQPSFNKAS
jgi:hypothetical protein